MTPLIQGKEAVVSGTGGPVGGAVALSISREGAEVSLAGRASAKLDGLAGEIRAADVSRTRAPHRLS